MKRSHYISQIETCYSVSECETLLGKICDDDSIEPLVYLQLKKLVSQRITLIVAILNYNSFLNSQSQSQS